MSRISRLERYDWNRCPRNQHYTTDSFVKSLAAAFISESLIFMSPTIPPKTVGIGIFIIVFSFILSIFASYGLLKECEFRSGVIESLIAFSLAYIIAVIFGILWSGHDLGTAISINFFTTDMVVGMMVGGFFGSIIK